MKHLSVKIKDWHIKTYCDNQKYDFDIRCRYTNILTMLCLETQEIITFTKDNERYIIDF